MGTGKTDIVALYLKLLDEEENNRELCARLNSKNGNGKLLFPDQAEHFRWMKWRFFSGNKLRDFIRDEVFPYMASLIKDEPQVAEYFRDAVLEIRDPSTSILRAVSPITTIVTMILSIKQEADN